MSEQSMDHDSTTVVHPKEVEQESLKFRMRCLGRAVHGLTGDSSVARLTVSAVSWLCRERVETQHVQQDNRICGNASHPS